MTAICQDDSRRTAVRNHRNQQGQRDLNGLDYLEVGADRTSLTVFFLGKLPRPLREDRDALKQFVRIEGGRRIRDIQVLDVAPHHDDDPERDDFMVVRVDKPGDHSTYALRMVGLEGIDPRYDRVEFSFMVDCASDLDCLPAAPYQPSKLDEPEISYLAKDYASFRQLILDRLALLIPDWQERHVPDIGLALVEVLAYAGDHLSYYQDAVATEAYLATARQRVSLRRHARLVDYQLGEGCNARAWVCIETSDDLPVDPKGIYFVTAPAGVGLAGRPVLSALRQQDGLGQVNTYEVFEPLLDQPIRLLAAHSKIDFHTWGQKSCYLPKGTTSATLLDHWVYRDQAPVASKESARRGDTVYERAQQKQPPSDPPEIDRQRLRRSLDLHIGDVLIFEEILSPKTGIEPDADPAHRHAVRLTRVARGEDVVIPQILKAGDAEIDLPTPVVEIEWAPEDALPFPLCLSAIVPNAACEYVENVSVARGNVILVDHGAMQPSEDLGSVPVRQERVECLCEGQPGDVVRTPGRFRPRLPDAPLTHRQRLPSGRMPATASLKQDPGLALPQVWLTSLLPGQINERAWTSRGDLLSSGPDDRHFVVEIENAGYARLRFGDDELGEQPEAGEAFWSTYRIGNGTAGNVGAEAITHAVFTTKGPGDLIVKVRNPMPAYGGTEPESIAEARLMAPSAFRRTLERAITAGDYARLAERNPRVQRAAATLAWTGSWYEADVAADAWGSETPDKKLLSEVKSSLYRYRRMGHDLSVEAAQYVPLAITLELCISSTTLRGHVKAALLEVFGTRVQPDGRLGFFHPDKLTFGDGIHLSRLVAAAQAVPGVESVRVTQLERQFEGPNGELANGLLPLGPYEIAQLDNDPDFPEHGQLTLVLKGGR